VTTANKISVFRILLVPVFIGCAVYFADSVGSGQPDERWRWATIAVFFTAAISDFLDGYLARRWDQRTRLGAILDPLADKLLMLSAMLTLSVTSWPERLPLWLPILAISHAVLTIIAAFVIHHVVGHCRIVPHWTGKMATACQMTAVLWSMIGINYPNVFWSALAAAIFTVWSGWVYLMDAAGQLARGNNEHESERA
jgi:cardiolipin synthase (CMP-forming)